jgi:hypothetical protein
MYSNRGSVMASGRRLRAVIEAKACVGLGAIGRPISNSCGMLPAGSLRVCRGAVRLRRMPRVLS